MIDYNAYLKVCRDAVADDEVFKTFKRHLDYIPILEHVTYEQGLGYIKEIQHDAPALFDHLSKFKTSDTIGKPHKRYFPVISEDISPTTLRYMKVLGDLVLIFGGLSDLDIVEIGGGYGGQCKIIHDIFNPRSYSIIDFPEALDLSEKYLGKFGIKINPRSMNDPTAIHYHILISNYAFSECGRKYQEFYRDNIISYSDMGYMTCNFIVPESLSRDEIISLKSNYRIYEERPLTSGDNLIYTWK